MKRIQRALAYIFSYLLLVWLTGCKKAGKEERENFAFAAIETVVRDTGLYSGFPWPAKLSNGTIVTAWKESDIHANPGFIMFGKSSNGGGTWSIKQIVLNGAPVQCTNLSLEVMPNNRIIISHQPNHTTSLYFAYSDDEGATWLPAAGGYTYVSGYRSAPFSKPVRLPSGKIIQPYYSIPSISGASFAGRLCSVNRQRLNMVAWRNCSAARTSQQ